VGFEPTRGLTTPNSFRDCPVQPLRHPSRALQSQILSTPNLEETKPDRRERKKRLRQTWSGSSCYSLGSICIYRDLWRSRYLEKALVGAERKAREREARGKQLRHGLSLERRHACAGWRFLAEG
jgi:hypothetical protein